jgi:hypothetical protein
MNGLVVGSLVTLAVMSVVWTIVLVAVALELRRTSWRLQEFVRSLELELKPTVQDAREAIRTLQRAAQGAADTTERVRGALLKLERVGEGVCGVTGTIRGLVGTPLIPAFSVLAGVRAGTKMLWTLYRARRKSS